MVFQEYYRNTKIKHDLDVFRLMEIFAGDNVYIKS